jgi:hypothetical protein
LRQLNKELNKTENFIEGRTKGIRGRFGTAAQSAALGGGFPLLFGGPSISAAGGALGGFAGGLAGPGAGFALGIIGSAIGGGIDEIIANAQEAGKALNSTGGALDFMREKSLLSTPQIEEQARVLEEQGRVSELSALLTEELVDKIGNKGVEALQGLGKETDETTRLWAELTLQLQALISGPLQGFLKLVNGFLGGITTGSRFAAFKQDIADDPEALKRFNEIEREVRGVTTRGLLGALTNPKRLKILQRAQEEGLRPVTAQIPVTKEDERRFTVKAKKDTAADKAAREAARIDARIEKLRLEREEIAKITQFKDKIAAAEAVQDKLSVRRLQGEQKVFEIQQAGLEALIGVKTQREREAIQATTTAKVDAARLDTNRDLNELQRQRNEKYRNTIESLNFELGITTALTRQEAERLRLEQELQALRDSKEFTDEQLQEIQIKKEGILEAQQPLNRFITDSTKALNDLEQVAVDVSQGIGSAVGDALTFGIDGLVAGTKSAQEVFADFLKNIAQLLLKTAAQMIATYTAIGIARLFAGVPASGGTSSPVNTIQDGGTFNLPGNIISLGGPQFAANGGPVKSGNPYIIGERGPELFVPRSSGRIVPNGRFGGGGGGDVNVVVNVDAKGSNAQGSDKDAKALGSAIGIAVRSELIKQKRPGGLLAS